MMQQQQPPAPQAVKPEVQQRKPFVMPPGFLFDSDMGRSIDTVLAAALLYGLGAKGRVIASAVSSNSLDAAAFCEVLARFYSGETPGTLTRQAAPVGLNDSAPARDGSGDAFLRAVFSRKTEDGKPAFRHSIESVVDTADPCVLYRNSLLSQKPGEATVVLAGSASNLAKLMRFPGAAEIVKQRVGLLVAALGCYSGDKPDPRVAADLAAARQLFEAWPGPVVAVGTEVGEAIPFPARSIDSAFAWAPVHPVVEAYKAFRPMPYDAPAQALAAAFYAGNQKESFFQVSETGTIRVDAEGRTRFTAGADGRHRYLIANSAVRDRLQTAYVEAVSAKPVPPRRPF